MKDNTPWAVRAVSGSAGGLERLAVVNLRVTCNADTVEEVRALADAAPDLLAALELAMLFAEKEATHLAIDCHMGASEWESFMPTWTTDARAAIARARGEG